MQIVMGYLNLYCKQRDYENALLLLDWALAFYPGLKCPQKRSYLDKSEAALWAVRADVLWRLEQKEDAADSLRKAKVAATAFDREPNYDARNIRPMMTWAVPPWMSLIRSLRTAMNQCCSHDG
mgnify:FL=1